MKKQYIIQKYVLASSVEEAVRKSKKTPIHEVFVHSAWLSERKSEFYESNVPNDLGFKKK